MNKNEHMAVYKIISVGDSTQELTPNGSINRPMIHGEGNVKKWGDEFIIFSQYPHDRNPSDLVFIGTVALNKKLKKFLKLFKLVDVPSCNIDYYVITLNQITKTKIDKVNDFNKFNNDSYSCILSCAYNKTGEHFNNQLIVVCQDGDMVTIDCVNHIFDEGLLDFTLS